MRSETQPQNIRPAPFATGLRDNATVRAVPPNWRLLATGPTCAVAISPPIPIISIIANST